MGYLILCTFLSEVNYYTFVLLWVVDGVYTLVLDKYDIESKRSFKILKKNTVKNFY